MCACVCVCVCVCILNVHRVARFVWVSLTVWAEKRQTDQRETKESHNCREFGDNTDTWWPLRKIHSSHVCQMYDDHLTVWPIMFYHRMNIHDGGMATHMHRWLACLIGRWQQFRWWSQLSTLKGNSDKHSESGFNVWVKNVNETFQ